MADQAGALLLSHRDEVDDDLTLEAEAVSGVGAVARAHADALPESSHWKRLFTDLAESLEEDAKKLGPHPLLFQPRPTKEEERAMVVAYTALWQLRDATYDVHGKVHESAILQAARLDLRHRLDKLDEPATVELTRKQRNLLGELAGERLYWLGDELMFTKASVETVKQPAERVAHLSALLNAIGWREKVKRKKARGRRWTVPTDVFIPAVDALIEEARTEQRAVADGAEKDREEGHPAEEASHRRSAARWEEALAVLIDLRRSAEEGGLS